MDNSTRGTSTGQSLDLRQPPQGVQDFDLLCACEKRRKWRWVSDRHKQIKLTPASCRMCAIFDKVVRAVVEGKLPTLFARAYTDFERNRILQDIIIEPESLNIPNEERRLRFRVDGRLFSILMFSDADKNTQFTIKGYKFRKEHLLRPIEDSDARFDRALRWLATCLECHSCADKTPGNLPIRLLLVQKDLAATKDIVRLVETEGHERPYTCLSYRWGDKSQRQLLTTARTLERHTEGIAFGELPKTFQDAVTVTQRMGLDYLWIDALCILQKFEGMTDVEERAAEDDWERQCSRMADYYQGCHFCISADISTGMDSGIFSRSPIAQHDLKVNADDGREVTLYIREETSHHGPPTQLETRGWIFQESLLPPRVLHFGSFDIQWRCRETHTCECGFNGKVWDSREQLAHAAEPIRSDDHHAVEYWETVIFHYTARILTNQDDKLPALSGVAQLFRTSTGWLTYLAGLWKHTLHHDLCWYTVMNTTISPLQIGSGVRPNQYRAPSWSWASVDTFGSAHCCFWGLGASFLHPVCPCSKTRKVCTIHSASCESKGSDRTGRVKYGYIDVSGVLIPATVAEHPQSSDMRWGGLCNFADMPWTLRNIEDNTDLDICMPDCELLDEGLKEGDKVYCMPIQEAIDEIRSERGCLILKRNDQRNQTEYQRVGFCILVKDNTDFEKEPITGSLHVRSSQPFVIDPENEIKTKRYMFQHDHEAQTRLRIV